MQVETETISDRSARDRPAFLSLGKVNKGLIRWGPETWRKRQST
jgi:hypothetical protein